MLVRWVTIAGFALAISRLAAGPGLIPGDVWLALQMQAVRLPALELLIRGTNWFGQSAVNVILATLLIALPLLWRGLGAEALLLILAGISRLLNTPVKLLLNSPRPTLEDIAVVEETTGFGFPSGHAMGAVLFFGALIIIAPAVVQRRWLAMALQAVCLILILITGVGRVTVGAHWPSDVLGGYLFGLLFLLPLGWLYHAYRWRINLRPGWFSRSGRRPAQEPPRSGQP